MVGQHGGVQHDRYRRSGKVCFQLFEHWSRAMTQSNRGFAISVPGLSHVAISREEAGTNNKSGARYAGVNRRRSGIAGDPIDAINVSD